jgi:hypothetical protein
LASAIPSVTVARRRALIRVALRMPVILWPFFIRHVRRKRRKWEK